MIPRHRPHRAVRPGQGPHAAEPADNLFGQDRDRRKHLGHGAAQIGRLVVAATGAVGVGLGNVGGPDQNPAGKGIEQVHPPVRRAEIDHPTVQRAQQRRTVHHQMRPATAAHQLRRHPQHRVHRVDPRPTGVKDHPRLRPARFAVSTAPGHHIPRDAQNLGVVFGPRRRVGRRAIQHQLQPQPLGMGDVALVIYPGPADVGGKIGQQPPQPAPPQHPVRRHRPQRPPEHVIQQQPRRRDGKAAIRNPGLHPEKPRRRPDDAAPDRLDRHHTFQRLHIMRRGGQQHVALDQRLAHQPEFAGLQILQPAVHQPRRGRRRAGTEIAPLQQQNAQPLQGQVAERGAAVDAAPDDDHVIRRDVRHG